jgi:hypothetical protein
MPVKILPVLALVTVLSVPVSGNDIVVDVVPDLSGFYACEGVGADGEAYRGVVQISRYHDVYRVRWAFSPEQIYSGIGVVTGDALAVAYFDGTPGVAAYSIGDGTHLVGAWTVVGADGGVYAETLTRFIQQVSEPDDTAPHPLPDPPQPRPATPSLLPGLLAV